MIKLRFRYTNHRGDDHEYTVEPHSLSVIDGHWAVTGVCLERDGKTRWEGSRGFPIRSFTLTDMRDVEEVAR
jgi:predicted DNA-binding transcriptional regulator YafY